MSQFVEEVTGAVFVSHHSHARDLGKVNALDFELSRMRHRYDIEIFHRLSVTQKNQGSVADAVDAATLFLKESEIVQTDDLFRPRKAGIFMLFQMIFGDHLIR